MDHRLLQKTAIARKIGRNFRAAQKGFQHGAVGCFIRISNGDVAPARAGSNQTQNFTRRPTAFTAHIRGKAERNRVLHFCMGEMNPDYREVLYLTYFEDMSYAQAAEVTGKTVKQITNMVYRGKESLRRLLEREGITNAES